MNEQEKYKISFQNRPVYKTIKIDKTIIDFKVMAESCDIYERSMDYLHDIHHIHHMISVKFIYHRHINRNVSEIIPLSLKNLDFVKESVFT